MESKDLDQLQLLAELEVEHLVALETAAWYEKAGPPEKVFSNRVEAALCRYLLNRDAIAKQN